MKILWAVLFIPFLILAVLGAAVRVLVHCFWHLHVRVSRLGTVQVLHRRLPEEAANLSWRIQRAPLRWILAAFGALALSIYIAPRAVGAVVVYSLAVSFVALVPWLLVFIVGGILYTFTEDDDSYEPLPDNVFRALLVCIYLACWVFFAFHPHSALAVMNARHSGS